MDRRPNQRQLRQPRLSGGAAKAGSRLRSFTFANGASGTYNNTRGLRMKIWTNP